MKISKLVASIACLCMMITANADSKLAGIELGSDYNIGCDKLKNILIKKEPKSVFKTEKFKCGFETGFEWVGIKTKDGSTVDYIGVTHTVFNYPFIIEAKVVAQDYIKTLGAVSHILDFDSDNNRYVGTNILGTERVTISYFVIAISKFEAESHNFNDIK